MTLVVCKRIANELVIHSDSKVIDDFSNGIESQLRQHKPLSGLLKTVILHPHVALSFAGQSEYATRFLSDFLKTQPNEWNTPKLLFTLLNIHKASNSEIDFIVCTCDARKPSISVIKDGKLTVDVESAWIGSQPAFNFFQEIFHSDTRLDNEFERARAAFKAVIENDELREVGHFHVEAYLSHTINRDDSVFVYELKSE